MFKIVFNVFSKICTLSFAWITFSTQSQSLFASLQFELVSDKNTPELCTEVLLSKAKLNHVNNEAIRAYYFVKKTSK